MSKFRQEQLKQPLSLTGSFTGSLLGTASYADFAGNVSPTDLSGYVSYSIFNAFTESVGKQIATGSISASVDTDPNKIFLIKSGSFTSLVISSSSEFNVYSNLFIIRNAITDQPVFTVSQSIVQFATQSTDPNITADYGMFWFTPNNLYIGLEEL